MTRHIKDTNNNQFEISSLYKQYKPLPLNVYRQK